ncbi:MAG: TerD family protein [Fibrella sp.]|nr:TerD family protein [Armatimonadota bacterium]
MNNAIYLRRRSKIVVPQGTNDAELLPLHYVATVVKNVEALGYGFTEDLIAACRALSLEQLVTLYQELVGDLKKLKGAHRAFQPMYPNFPKQVMEMPRVELYLNAIVHYWSDGKLFPASEVKERFPLLDNTDLKPIDLGTQGDFAAIFGQLAAANTSLSEQDKEDITWFVATYRNAIGALLPDAIPQKENMAFVAGLLIQHTDDATTFVQSYCKTATDVLRLAVAMSGGDVSLATNTKFRTFSRPERRVFLGLLERIGQVTEDMLRHKGRWIRLGEKLHVGEFGKRYPDAAKAFDILRNDLPYTTFNGHVEKALAAKDVEAALAKLTTRAGDFARRLDHLLRLNESAQATVIAAFGQVAQKVSTPVLLQVRHHFAVRPNLTSLRVFFPKGNVAKAQGVENNLPPLSADVCNSVVTACEERLVERFMALPPLGTVYIDPELSNYVMPFAMRSASKSLRTLVRGSKLPLPAGDVLRFFLWWKNGTERTDIDLSAVLLNAAFEYVDILSYYNLQGFGGCHSGDIVDAPEGASEFIDVTLKNVREKGVRYIVMSVNSYSQQPFVDLPECFAGWMARTHPESGEIYEPKTVHDRVDLTADTKLSIPLVIDVVDNKVIWCDMGLRNHPNFQNNVHGNRKGINVTVRSLVELQKPNLYDLFRLHAIARGEQVGSPDDAETVFSVANETPFRVEEIASQYMA